MTKPLIEPIYQTSNFLLEGFEPNHGYTYSRSANPTRDALQKELAQLENAKYGLCFGSGLAAVDAVMRLFKAGDEIVCFPDLYGGSYRLFNTIHKDKVFTYDKMLAITPKTKAIFMESPTNPTLQTIDIRETANFVHKKGIYEFAHKNEVLLIVDNTLASPYYQNPLDMGADIVIHSVSKYINGHGDVVMGAVCLNNSEIYDKLYFIQRMCGAVPGPQDCWLVSRGLKTLGVRMEKITQNATKVAEWLLKNPKVKKVNYPGFSGVISFSLKEDTERESLRICNATKAFKFAVSLGGFSSLITHCASTNNAIMEPDYRRKIGVTDSMIRLSIGLEDPQVLISDLDQAI